MSDKKTSTYQSIDDFKPSLDPRDVRTFPVRQALTSLNTDRNNKGLDPVDISPLDDWTISSEEKNLAEKEKRKPKTNAEIFLKPFEGAERFVNVTPEDGRYRDKLFDKLAPYVCEAAYVRARIIVESLWLRFLIQEVLPAGTVALQDEDIQKIMKFADEMPVAFTLRVGQIEEKTRHDVIGMITALREKFADILTPQTEGYVHLGLTSEDVNDMAQKIMFVNALKHVLLPEAQKLVQKFREVGERLDVLINPDTPDFTLGAMYKAYALQIEYFLKVLFEPNYLTLKFSGATGTHAALGIIKQEGITGKDIATKFTSSVAPDFHYLPVTDQINPHDDFVVWASYLHEFAHFIETICSDIWVDSGLDVWLNNDEAVRMLYIRPEEGQSGSSAMPQKVQVINIENARGTAQELQGMTAPLITSLNINRQQRELSDSKKIRGMLGSMLPKILHILLNMQTDIVKLEPNKQAQIHAEKDMQKEYTIGDDCNGRKIKTIHELGTIIQHFQSLALKYASLPLLGRTHNQPASPTTLGKEFNVFAHRIQYVSDVLKMEIHGKRTNNQMEIDVVVEALGNILENVLRDLELYAQRGLLSFDYEVGQTLDDALGEGEVEEWKDILVDLLDSIDVDPDRCSAELENHYECLGEALQTILRQYQVENAYEIVKKVTRGVKMNKADYQGMLTDLFADPKVVGKLPEQAKTYLLELTPQTFVGEAPDLAKL